MFFCNNCGATFETAKTIEEHHPYGMSYVTEHWAVCPHCEDTDIQEAERCERCGEYVAQLDDGLCDICYIDMCD